MIVRTGTCKLFTLVEMLVVITIIAILSSILMPALRQAIKGTRALSCVNNLKLFAMNNMNYSNDCNGWAVPTDFASDGCGFWLENILFRNYFDMGKNPEMLYKISVFCPESNPVQSSPAAGKFSATSSSSWLNPREIQNPEYRYPAGSYGMPYWTLVNEFAGGASGNFTKAAIGFSPSYRISRIKRPSKSIVFCDSLNYRVNEYTMPDNSVVWIDEYESVMANKLAYRHMQNSNLAFFDGHVKPTGRFDHSDIINTQYSLTEFNFMINYYYNQYGNPHK